MNRGQATPPHGKVVFRPSLGLRSIAAAMCLISLAVWLTIAFTSESQEKAARMGAASILALPFLAGAAVLFRRIEAGESGLSSVSLVGTRRIQWPDIRRIDVRRGSFVIESNVGPVSAALVDERRRESLLRLLVERAALTRSMEELPWGIQSRYIPRRQDIGFTNFTPHNRRPKDEDTC